MTDCERFRRQSDYSHTRQINRRIRQQSGFSLVELAVVVIIILIIAAAAVPPITTALSTSRLRRTFGPLLYGRLRQPKGQPPSNPATSRTV